MKQLSFFDPSGALHADMHCGMTLDKHVSSRATLAGMKFVFIPAIKPDRAYLALETLRQMHIDISRQWAYADWIDEPIEVEVWPGKVLVDFRKYDSNDEGTVRLSSRQNRLYMSLPNVASWSDCGLAWIYSHTGCWKEKQNPTPWFGRICDCPPPIVKKLVLR